tara:strand:+ start:175 stop:600 length:426 start_codon:yes stop_codon:yes gene_type:complete
MKTNVLILSLVLLLNFEGLANGNKLDAYGGFKNVFGKKTGFFHTEKIDGRWWLITPEGHGFFGIGISHPVTHFSQGAVIFGYGNNQEAWLRDGIKKCGNWATIVLGADRTVPSAISKVTSIWSWPAGYTARKRFRTGSIFH